MHAANVGFDELGVRSSGCDQESRGGEHVALTGDDVNCRDELLALLVLERASSARSALMREATDTGGCTAGTWLRIRAMGNYLSRRTPGPAVVWHA